MKLQHSYHEITAFIPMKLQHSYHEIASFVPCNYSIHIETIATASLRVTKL